jgi:hypothetical protein
MTVVPRLNSTQFSRPAQGIKHLIVYGLATDYCVKSSVMDALALGYSVIVVEDLLRGVAPDTSAAAIAGKAIIGWELPGKCSDGLCGRRNHDAKRLSDKRGSAILPQALQDGQAHFLPLCDEYKQAPPGRTGPASVSGSWSLLCITVVITASREIDVNDQR